MSWQIDFVPSGNKSTPFRASIVRGRRVPFERFLQNAQDKTSLTKADLQGAVTELANWIVNCSADGKECDLGPLGGSRLGAKGAYDTIPKQLREWRNIQLTVSWTLSAQIRREFRAAPKRIKRHVKEAHRPMIKEVRAVLASKKEPYAWQAGGMLEIYGNHLKFDPDREDEGVFLSRNTPAIEVRPDVYQSIHPKQIVLLVPKELAGEGILRLTIARRVYPHDENPVSTTLRRKLKELGV